MKTPTIHLKDNFETNAEFLCFALTHPTIPLTRMYWEFADACVEKYSKYLDEVLLHYPQVHLICDDPRVAVAFAKRYDSTPKPQRMKFKADHTIGD